MNKELKRFYNSIEYSLEGIAITRAMLIDMGEDSKEIDEFIQTKGNKYIKEHSNLSRFETVVHLGMFNRKIENLKEEMNEIEKIKESE